MIIRIGMFMRKILQYAILILLGMNSVHALSNPFKAMSNAVSGCKPSLVRDVAKLLPKTKDGDVSFAKKVNTMNKCIGKSATTLKKNHSDIAKTTASLCSSDKKFASKFPDQCKVAIAANKAIQAEDKAKKDKAKRAKAKKSKKPSLYSRMMGTSDTIDPIEPVDDMNNKSLGSSSSEVCSPQLPGQALLPYGVQQPYGPNAQQMPGQSPSPYGVQQPYGPNAQQLPGQAPSPYGMQQPYGPSGQQLPGQSSPYSMPAYPYSMSPSPAYGQASAVPQMYGQLPQYPVNQYYGYSQPQGVYPDSVMNGQMNGQIVNTLQNPINQYYGYPQAQGVSSYPAMNGQMTGHMVNTPQRSICSCP